MWLYCIRFQLECQIYLKFRVSGFFEQGGDEVIGFLDAQVLVSPRSYGYGAGFLFLVTHDEYVRHLQHAGFPPSTIRSFSFKTQYKKIGMETKFLFHNLRGSCVNLPNHSRPNFCQNDEGLLIVPA